METEKLINYEPKHLEEIERETTEPKYSKYVKYAIMIVVGIVAFFYVVNANLLLIGEPKPAMSRYLFNNTYAFKLSNPKYNFATMIPLHSYAFLDTNSVTQKMLCLIKKESKFCKSLSLAQCHNMDQT